MKSAKTLMTLSAAAVVLSGCAADNGQGNAPAETTDAGPISGTTPAEDLGPLNDGVYDGPRVTNLRGGYQAQIEISGGEIVRVSPIEAGTDAPESVQTNAFALPALIERVLEAQSADVEHVSGSSFTSPAFLESVAGALDQARA